MAELQNVSTPLFIAADYYLEYTVYDSVEKVAILDTAPLGLNWMLKKSVSQPDSAAILQKSPSFGLDVVGLYNPDPALNTQVVRVPLFGYETYPLKPGTYHYELKRMDPGFEAVLSYGTFKLALGVHRT